MSSSSEIPAFEVDRERRIAANKRKLEELGICGAVDSLCSSQTHASKTTQRKRKLAEPSAEPSRRSDRAIKRVNYSEDDFPKKAFGSSARRLLIRKLDDASAVVANLRLAHGREAGQDAHACARSVQKRGPQDSGKGVRIQGGRIYDSKFGMTCHWCRQKTLEDKVTCTMPNCGGGRRMPTSFCKMCLWNRHGEDVAAAEDSGCWVCPGCRGSCGRGCLNCCNCGPCRKKQGLPPTHQIAKEARENGFSNVHDYLVYLVTRESSEVIAARKSMCAWGKWLSGTLKSIELSQEREDGAGCSVDPSSSDQETCSDATVLGAPSPVEPTPKNSRRLKAMIALGLATADEDL